MGVDSTRPLAFVRSVSAPLPVAAFFNRELAPDDVAAVKIQLDRCGCPVEGFVGFLQGEGGQALDKMQEEADQAGVFAVPTLIIEGELYWGQDRFDMALAAAGVV